VLKNNSKLANKATEMSIFAVKLRGNGLIVAVIPKIRKTFSILEPITFPIAISEFFLYAATTDVANSGNEVPIATIVKPIIASLKPKICAIFTAPSTK